MTGTSDPAKPGPGAAKENAAGETGATVLMRRMRESDIPAVRAIEERSFSNPWSANTFRGEIQNTSVSFPWVILSGPEKRVVGYILYWKVGDEVQINNVAIHPDFRGRGIGEAVVRFVVERVRKEGVNFVTLEVRPSNLHAFKLYLKLGFKVLGTRKEYYTNPTEDAYVMGLTLGEPKEEE